MNKLIWMATLSFWQSQYPACTPIGSQDFVAKFVDSAQLKPWLKPEWYAPATTAESDIKGSGCRCQGDLWRCLNPRKHDSGTVACNASRWAKPG